MVEAEKIRNKKRSAIQNKVLESWEDNDLVGTYQVSMGLGKGKIIAEAIKIVLDNPKYYNNIVDRAIPILIQVSSTYLRDTDTVRELILWGVPKELIESGKIKFVCYHTSYKWKRKDIGLMISDEVDYSLTSEYSRVFNIQAPIYNLCLSGTFIDTKIELGKTLKFFPPIRYSYPVAEAQKDGIVNNNEIIVHYVPLDSDKNIKIEYKDKITKETKSFYTSEVEQYKYIEKEIAMLYMKISTLQTQLRDPNTDIYEINSIESDLLKYKKQLEFKQFNPVNKKSRANIIYKLQSLTNYAKSLKEKLLEDKNNKVIIFCKFTDTIDKITDNGFHSKVEISESDIVIEDFNYGISKSIGVSKKANRGINFTGLNHCIAHSYTSSETDYFQGAKGRMTRLPVDQIAYIHILVSYYKEIDKDGKEEIKYCQNWKWASKFLEKETSNMTAVTSIEEALQIIK